MARYVMTDETRKRMSEAAKRRCTPEERQLRRDRYETKLPTEDIKRMYCDESMTQTEIAAIFGVTQKIIWRHMRNYGIKARVAAKRNQRGENNHCWKGDDASYKAFHQRLKLNRGEARTYGCSVCGTHDTNEKYDWANLTGKYGDMNDYAPMCRKCHRRYDALRKKVA